MSVFNRECLVAKGSTDPYTEQERLRHCTRLSISDPRLVDSIGEGAFGKLYKVKLSNGSLVAVKVIKTKIDSEGSAGIISDFHAEVQYASRMSKYRLGPKIYDAFYSVQNNYVVQNIIMEYFDMSVDKWIDSDMFPRSATKVVSGMIDLIRRQVFKYGIYCCDVKPHNFVIKLGSSGITEVRMIDFGTDWCNDKIPYIYITDPALRALPRKIQIMSYYIMCLIQLFMTLQLESEHRSKHGTLLRPFFSNKDFMDFVIRDGARHGISMRLILYDILSTNKDQAKLFRHYIIDKGESVTSLVNRVFKTIADYQ